MGQYEVRHQCDPKTCVYCGHYYQDRKSGCSRCDKGYDDMVGRYAVACDDFVDGVDEYYKRTYKDQQQKNKKS